MDHLDYPFAHNYSPPQPRLSRPSSFSNLRVRTNTEILPSRPSSSTSSSSLLSATSQRSHLGGLDLAGGAASLPANVPFKRPRSRTTSASPAPLTPPLTPSSSFGVREAESESECASATDVSAPATPPSALWARTRLASVKGTTFRHRTVSASTDGFSASSERSQEDQDVLARRLDLGLGIEDEDVEPSRFLQISNVPATVSADVLKQALGSCGDVKGILVAHQATQGLVFVAFYDLRHAVQARRWLEAGGAGLGAMLAAPAEHLDMLEATFISAFEMTEWTEQVAFVTENQGELLVEVSEGNLSDAAVEQALSKFGSLRSFARIANQAYGVEFFDSRDSARAVSALDGKFYQGARLSLVVPDPAGSDSSSPEATPLPRATRAFASPALPSSAQSSPHRPAPLELSPARLSAHEQVMLPSTEARAAPAPAFKGPFQEFVPRHLQLQQAAAAARLAPAQAPWTFGAGSGPGFDFGGPNELAQASMDGLCYAPAGHGVVEFPGGYSPYGRGYAYAPAMSGPSIGQFPYALGPDGVPYALPLMHGYLPMPFFPPGSPARAFHPGGDGSGAATGAGRGPLSMGPAPAAAPRGGYVQDGAVPGPRGVPRQNQLDIGAIESGRDTRTTVMIKNIPNKMTDNELLKVVQDVGARMIDFFYLRIDFKTGCNVGYAFVNFIDVQDLLKFAKTKLGMNWNVYSSNKALEMCYANYQGKEALVEKFRNSSIMDEREQWRPKIFHSFGSARGLPEEFPAPTHLRRKQLSAANRGALFVPGALHAPVQFPSLHAPPPRAYHQPPMPGPRLGPYRPAFRRPGAHADDAQDY